MSNPKRQTKSDTERGNLLSLISFCVKMLRTMQKIVGLKERRTQIKDCPGMQEYNMSTPQNLRL